MATDEAAGKRPDHSPHRGTLRTLLIALGLAGIALIALYLVRSFATALLLIFAGVLFGVFLDGVAALLAKWLHLSRLLALSLVVLFGLDLCALFIWLAGPQVTQQIQQLGEQLPQSITLLQHRLENPTGV